MGSRYFSEKKIINQMKMILIVSFTLSNYRVLFTSKQLKNWQIDNKAKTDYEPFLAQSN